ncbi:NAD(+) diphosphatase [Coralloluteibacterium stylophorae]|uniref:NAD(+) diphosphatase n=2 Tax=Coralloluteibacterium stylophorae TaxID=1776034 RepID=A0AAP2CDW6_9GAMM|nr:NAD(+) diphosphatase [Coralloluteibacterium stylophorae]
MSAAGAPFAFVGPAPDRADALRDDAAALAALWPAAGVLVVDREGRTLAQGDAPWLATGAALGDALREAASFLGLDGDGRGYFALPLTALETAGHVPPGDLDRIDLRAAAAAFSDLHVRLFAHARALLHWQARKRFCGVCGHALAFTRGGHQGNCPECGSTWYPRTDAAIIVAVTDGERLLLGRQASWPAGRYSVLAGFVEPGESLEDALRREVMEEACVAVTACHYVASQPWPFPASLMVGFRAEAGPAAPVCGIELEDVRWLSAREIRAGVAAGTLQLSPPLSISRRLIDDWLGEHPDDPRA